MINLNLSKFATVTVTFNPDLEVLMRQIKSIPSDCKKIIVDNASQNLLELRNGLVQIQNIHFICNEVNLGLAEALNIGANFACTDNLGVNYILMLDQDTEPKHGSIENYFEVFQKSESELGKIIMGPRIVDVESNIHHGFHVMTKWCWRRVYPQVDQLEQVLCANINGSGILLSTRAWIDSGGMDSSLFIDHVDTDWTFKMFSKGYTLLGLPCIVFKHRMGEASRRVWFFGWHLLPIRSPLRHYYLYRNTLRLMQRNYVPAVWKIWAIAKMLITLPMVLLMGPERIKQLSAIIRGLRDV